MRDFRDLEVWKKAHQLTLDLYRATENFPQSESFGLTEQIRRTSASIATNLSAGCGGWGDADMAKFVLIAMESTNELEYQLLLATDLGYMADEEYHPLVEELYAIRRMLTIYYKKVKDAYVTR